MYQALKNLGISHMVAHFVQSDVLLDDENGKERVEMDRRQLSGISHDMEMDNENHN